MTDLTAILIIVADRIKKVVKKFLGEKGAQRYLAFARILQNVFNIYPDTDKIDRKQYTFSSYCLDLGDVLYDYACKEFLKFSLKMC